MTKKCFKCNLIKDISHFYIHTKMADGHLNKCKTCTKKDVKNRYDKPEVRLKIIEYEKRREQNPKRKIQKLLYQKRLRAKSLGRYKARQKVSNALRDGRIIKQNCIICNNPKSEAHHPDYRRYLYVLWLCRKHHLEKHNKIPF